MKRQPGARSLFAINLIFFCLVSGILLWAALGRTEGQFIYPLDDAYIHLAIADQWAQTGVWGISPGQFASASSSPLFTFCLGLGARLGLPLQGLPLGINLIFASGGFR